MQYLYSAVSHFRLMQSWLARSWTHPITRWPFCRCVTPSPTSSIYPAASAPKMVGYFCTITPRSLFRNKPSVLRATAYCLTGSSTQRDSASMSVAWYFACRTAISAAPQLTKAVTMFLMTTSPCPALGNGASLIWKGYDFGSTSQAALLVGMFPCGKLVTATR